MNIKLFRPALSIASLVSSLSMATSAHAQPTAPPAPGGYSYRPAPPAQGGYIYQPMPPAPDGYSYHPAPLVEHWYGYQILIVDGVALTLGALGAAFSVQGISGHDTGAEVGGIALAFHGGLVYLFGAPTVHWAHGRVGIGFASLGIRILSPILGLAIGGLESQLANGSKNQDGIPIGAAVGAVAAMAVDAIFLSHEKVPGTRPAAKLPLPSVMVTRHGMMLGIGSTF